MRGLRRKAAHLRALGVLAVLAAAPGCTLFDFWPEGGLKGQPLTPDQPSAAVTLSGEMYSDRIGFASEGCTPGNTFFWGEVRNTGDMDVNNVSIFITVYDGAGNALGTFPPPEDTPNVFNGTVETLGEDPATSVDVAGTELIVEQAGYFTVCTTVPFGAAARTTYTTSFTEVEGTQ